ncbi:protein arginine kinase [candidate division WOR-3 bacterium]|nr:protein arginine kinase [candidate division WOR-3 bacterium]
MGSEKLRILLENPPKWIDGRGEFSEMVLSSRARFARNIRQFSFPNRAKENELEEILDFIKSHINKVQSAKCPTDPADKVQSEFVTPLSEISPIDKELLVERRLISREFSRKTRGRGVGIWDSENIGLMINGEDHIRIHSIYSGLNLELAYEKVSEFDDKFSKSLPYAFSPRFGYFTACPINTGTGLRVSVLVHLPGLVHSGKIKKVLEMLSKTGFMVKGFYGDGTMVEGNFFQISNQITLGKKEEEIINELHETVLQIIEYENNAREFLLSNARAQLEDKIWRAYSILKNARLLSNEEFVSLSSAVRFGIGLGILKSSKVSLRNLNKLLIFTQPAHLQKITGKSIDPIGKDARRALYVRENL